MALNERISRFDFEPWAGVAYVIDPNLPADYFYCDVGRVFHLGAGTDVQLRLFWLNLTDSDRKFLKAMMIGID